MEAEIALGNTMQKPAFTEGDGRLRRFDLVTANPMWNQRFDSATYENDTACRRRPARFRDGCSTWPSA